MLIVIIPGKKCKNLKILSLESKAAIACCGQSSQVFKQKPYEFLGEPQCI